MFPIIIYAQVRDVEQDYCNMEIVNNQVNELYNYPVFNIKDNETILSLKAKFKSELNTVASCVIYYKYSKLLKLTENEQTELLRQIERIAEKFIEIRKYVLFEWSGGYAPVVGVKEGVVAGQKVSIVMYGGDCVINDIELKENEIYSKFNSKVKQHLNKI